MMGGSAGGVGLQGLRHDVAEGEAQGDELAGEDEEHGRLWCSSLEKRERLGKRSNRHGFVKLMA